MRLGSIPLSEQTNQTAETMMKTYARNPAAFERGWRQNPRGEGDKYFPSWGKCLIERSVLEIIKPSWRMRSGVDVSKKTRPGNVIFTVAQNPKTFKFIPVEVKLGRWDSPTIIKEMHKTWLRWGQHSDDFLFMPEDNGVQGWLTEWIQSDELHGGRKYEWAHRIDTFETQGYNKWDENSGLPSLEIEFGNQGWQIPHKEFNRHLPECECGWCTWAREVESFPACTGDTIMAKWFAREGFSRKRNLKKAKRVYLPQGF